MTMGDADPRLPERTNGLGVVVEGEARFYPMDQLDTPIDDDWGGRVMRVGLGEIDGAPHATWADDGERPMQLLSRWYGFAYTFPDCAVVTG